jgi:peroxiredoxin
VAICPDTVALLQGARTETTLSYDLYSDPQMKSGSAFGIAYRVQDRRYIKMLQERLGRADPMLPVPSAFLLDEEGTIVFSYVNPDYKVRIPAAVILSAATHLARPEDE